MTEAQPLRVIRLPARIETPISWRGKPGWLGLGTRYSIKWTDGVYRRCSRQTIIAYGDGH